jgi:hypothetical protein
MTSTLKTTYTIDTYTAAWDDAVASRGGGLAAGDQYRHRSDSSPDGREIDAFGRRRSEAGLSGEYSHSEDGWDYYDLVVAQQDDEDYDDDMDGDHGSALESVYGPND